MISILLALAAPDAAPPPPIVQEQAISFDVPDAFKPGWHQHNDRIDMIEFVVPPETVETWTRMVTSQVLTGAALRIDLEDFYTNWRRGLAANCPQLTASETWGQVDEVRAIRADLVCALNPKTGKPEYLSATMISGRENFFILQVAFRHPIGKGDQKLIDHVTQSLKVCDGEDRKACGARKWVGFVATGK
jgi:hypothetical protein